MKIRKIILENIRSYKKQEVVFPEGSTLLSGDIGAGKSSILLAIEFALFGLQPGQRGASLLRNGEDKGEVEMLFEIENKEIEIKRTLKRGKTISQDYCSIIINGEKKEISVTELKNRVLNLLNYPSEFSKKQNLLYKFTVYTPQEEMKQIILQEADTRMNTLRHIFGIDKYKRVLENISIILSKIRSDKRVKEELTANLEQEKLNIINKEEEIETKRYNLESVRKEFFIKQEIKKKIQEERDSIREKIDEKNKFQQEIEKTNIMILNKKSTMSDNNKTIEQLQIQLNELNALVFDESKIKDMEEEIKSIKKDKEKLEENILKNNSEIASFMYKKEEALKLEIQISNLESCPTCLQEVDAVYRANVLNKLHTDISRAKSKIEELESERINFTEERRKIDSRIYLKEKELTNLKILKVKLQEIEDKEQRIRELENYNNLMNKDIELLTQHIEELRNSVYELSKFDRTFEIKTQELEDALKEERMAEVKVAELKKEIEVFNRQIEELKERVQKSENLKKELNHLYELENWISKEFVPITSLIEKNVMIKLKKDFSEFFSKWFCILVSDTFNVRVSDNFTPIVEYQDYEIDYSYLSGGERTAVALAYRLALNQVINSLLSKIKTKDLVILDEPTDGFSDQQLDKMRDVLQQLNVSQLIIVSHDQKIEGFVENVIKFKKDQHNSFIEY